MIRKVLIANRGEIAVRAIRAARELDIFAVAVYSEADEQALHVRLADQSVALGGSSARETYLNSRKLIAAAVQTGSDAVYPGYGFLAENSAFAAAVIKAGLVFIGPRPEIIAMMGDKDRARRAAIENGVPVIPGTTVEQGFAGIVELIEQTGFPIVIKAVAGGSGRGMRVVHSAAELETKIGEAQREAEAAFGDGRIIAEKYLEHPRHIEVQVFGDSHGNVIHLGERDCSTQRRNQKLVEESPAPGLDPALRREIVESAVRLASAVGYSGAGTVECLVPVSRDAFFFLEMNTRIQVEHPVTEAVTGIDLVALQFRTAAGEKLPYSQTEIVSGGHAIEFRIYAEQPLNDFRPALGTIEYMLRPGGIGVREDSWVEAGTTVSPYYDSLLSKIVVWGRNRTEALARSRRVLDQTLIEGIETSLPFHRDLIRSADFIDGRIDVGWIARLYHPARLSGAGAGKAVGPLELTRIPSKVIPAAMVKQKVGRKKPGPAGMRKAAKKTAAGVRKKRPKMGAKKSRK